MFIRIALFAILLGLAHSETKEEWDARINSNIDKHRKNDVHIKIPITSETIGKKLRLMVNQTRQSLPLGTALNTNLIANCWLAGDDDNYCGFARDNFNLGVAENSMKWPFWEPNRDQFNSYNVDQMFNWCLQKNWLMRGHNLFWDVDDTGNYPGWVYGLYGQEMVEAIQHRISTTIPYFTGKVQHWDVNNEMLHGNFFTERTGDPDIRTKMFQWTNQADPSQQLFVNDYNVEIYGETDAYIDQIRDLLSRGAPITGIGCQAHFGPSRIDFDLLELNMNRLWNEFSIPIWITEFDWNGDDQFGNHQIHAEELDRFYRLMMSLPFIDGVLMWGFWDQAHWRPQAAITNYQEVVPNAAGIAYMDLYHGFLQTHLTTEAKLAQKVGDEIEFSFRAFRGDYEIKLVDDLGKVVDLPRLLTVSGDTEFRY